eukprot:CAMPEP_0170391690 /NCGR_PEP_ID=MMETSP0117_2-20130122/19802_1 /TAXON_ID=400756 /ORGANISM="Durinskia baltica, Strain CSIRO CS-38" /LENGTH=445 /DNA_ID=CAMNT_0010647795 /DNA_START=8 /DNA_END=1342 /DNA_ORIENTATION=-
MQMCKEDDFGQVPYDDFNVLLQQLRIDALHNAVVESDVGSLRAHLILLSRREGHQDRVLPVWDLRSLLLSADQLCLSRMQIHVILMIVYPDEHGYVDFEYFLRVCCTVIPHMFDTRVFKEKAETIAKEKADELDKKEMEELQGLQSSLAAKRRADEEDQEDVQANAPDRDAVEKALIHVGNQADDKHRPQPTLEVRKFLEAMRQESVQSCQLSDAEMRGFIAEAEIDPNTNEISYVEHIKTWVPIIFELRKSRVYDSILSKDWGFDAPQLADLSAFEAEFPLYLAGEGDGGAAAAAGAPWTRAVAIAAPAAAGRTPGSGGRATRGVAPGRSSGGAPGTAPAAAARAAAAAGAPSRAAALSGASAAAAPRGPRAARATAPGGAPRDRTRAAPAMGRPPRASRGAARASSERPRCCDRRRPPRGRRPAPEGAPARCRPSALLAGMLG